MKAIYCCKCERETFHREVNDDEFFEFGLECLVCHIVWEATRENDAEEDGSFERDMCNKYPVKESW